MKFITDNWMLILAVFMSGGYLLFTGLRKTGSGLSPALAVQWINHEKAVVVDTRSQEQYETGHIVNARNVTLEQLKSDALKGLPINKSLPLILVCATGHSAQKGIAPLKAAGYENVQVLAGGIGGWVKAQLPLEAGAAPVKGKNK